MIPKKALPVVREIRDLVPKPKMLPKLSEFQMEHATYTCLGFNKSDSCPMGLLPYALADRPHADEFGDLCPLTHLEVEAFFTWWDEQRDAEQAVADVWENSLE